MASKPPESRKEAWNRFFLTALGKDQPRPHHTLTLGFSPPGLRDNKCLLLKPLSLWHLVTQPLRTNTMLHEPCQANATATPSGRSASSPGPARSGCSQLSIQEAEAPRQLRFYEAFRRCRVVSGLLVMSPPLPALDCEPHEDKRSSVLSSAGSWNLQCLAHGTHKQLRSIPLMIIQQGF